MEQVAKRVLAGLQKRWGPIFQHQVINILAYGSGAFPQTKDKQVFASNTLDLIVEVRSPENFHREVMRTSPNDYSGAVSIAGSSLLNWTGNSLFPMHSNHINLEGKPIKYSVIGHLPLREDLRTWKYLSFAGRLHKPVFPLRLLAERLGEDMNRNRETAAAVALLLFGGKARQLSHAQFFNKICQISYLGDVRFAAGAENPMKTQNIVNNNYAKFQEIYLPILKKFSSKIPTSLTIDRDQMSFLYTAPSLAYLLTYFPSSLLDPISQLYPANSTRRKRSVTTRYFRYFKTHKSQKFFLDGNIKLGVCLSNQQSDVFGREVEEEQGRLISQEVDIALIRPYYSIILQQEEKMANFYTESDEPLIKVTDLTYRGCMITSPKLQQRRYIQPSPLSVITKFILCELEKPVLANESIVKRIKDCKVENAKNKYVRKELYKTLNPASHTKI